MNNKTDVNVSKPKRPFSVRTSMRMRPRRRNTLMTIAKTRRNVKIIKDIAEKDEEKKFYSIINLTSAPSTGQVINLTSGIAQGTGAQQRVGDEITLTSLQYRFQITVADTTNLVRIIIFQWFPTSVPVLSNILIDGATYPWLSAYSHDYRLNFRILYDDTQILNNTDKTQYYRSGYITRGFRKKVQYIASSTASTNNMYVMIVSDSTALTHPGVQYSLKLNYRDA